MILIPNVTFSFSRSRLDVRFLTWNSEILWIPESMSIISRLDREGFSIASFPRFCGPSVILLTLIIGPSLLAVEVLNNT